MAPPTPASGSGLTLPPTRLQETSEDVDPPLPPFLFQRLLTNLTTLRIRTNPSPSGQSRRGPPPDGAGAALWSPHSRRLLSPFYHEEI